MPVPTEPLLTVGERRAVAQAVAQFNRGFYFECHDTIEHVWLELRGPSRDFFQALIQVSVGFHHLERGNQAGAQKTFTRALGRFAAYPACYLGFDVAAERSRLQTLLSALAENVARIERTPTWRLDGLPVVLDRP